MSKNGAKPGAKDERYPEFRLRSTSSANFNHNIMILTGSPVSLSDFTTPLRLVRDPNARSELEGRTAGEGEIEEGRMTGGRHRKRKTRMINCEDEEEVTLREQEAIPWLLEDFDSQHSYVGRLEGGQQSNYVFFVNQGNEFRVLPASKWYRFTPKLSYRPLTLEEAEQHMANRGRSETYDRWLMKHRGGLGTASGTASPTSSTSSGNRSQQASGEPSHRASAEPLNKGPRVTTRLVNLEEEGFDYNEIVDDDEGEELYGANQDEEDPSMPRIERSARLNNIKLSTAGKQVKKLMKHLDRTNYVYESDEELDPYADDEDQEQSEEETTNQERERERHNLSLEASSSKIEAAPSSSITSRQPAQRPGQSGTLSKMAPQRSRSKSPQPGTSRTSMASSVPSPTASPPRSPPIAAGGAIIITEAEIVAILREAPLRTKDLISRVKGKLRANAQNKEIFREIVRRVATVRPSASGDEDKLLELRPEFR